MTPKIAAMLFFIIFFLTEGCGGSVLNRITRVRNGGSVQILAFFDERPVYDSEFSGKRLDLTLPNTVLQPDFVPPEADNIMTRTLIVEDRDTVVLSFFFRYSPQHLTVDAGPANSLAVTLVPGNRFTKTYHELMAGLGSVKTEVNRPGTTVEPLTFSPYALDWRLFFERYQGFSFIELTPRLSFPPFPLTALLPRGLSDPYLISLPAVDEFKGSDWFDALAEVQKRLKNSTSEQERAYLALAYADLLLRLGNSRTAHEQFNLLAEKYPDTDVGRLADYARIVIEAGQEHFYKAHLLLERLLEKETKNSPLSSFIRLSLAECLLATGQYMQAQPYLEEPIAPTEQAAITKDIRQADLFFATKRFEQAAMILASHADSTHLDLQPFSLNNYCTLLYRQKEFEQSAQCYRRLKSSLTGLEKQEKARYLSALSRLQAEDEPAVTSIFEELAQSVPDSKIALRSRIKQADLCYLRRPDCSAEALAIYQEVSESPISRDISLEAQFKVALINHLTGNDRRAVAELDYLLRKYQSGSLRNEALALLIQIFPGVLSDLLMQKQDIAALSLARRNRSLFINDWIDHSFLFQLGLALERLSLNNDALNLFLYLRRFADFQLDDDLIFALIRVSHALADQNLVEDFSSTYLLHFPSGSHRQDVLHYLIDSSLNSGRIDRAVSLLPDPLPQRRDFRLLAAAVYFFADNHQAAANLFLELDNVTELSDNQRFMLAESLFKTGRRKMCTELYGRLIETGTFKELSLYRLAQLGGSHNNEDGEAAISASSDAEAENNHWHRLFVQKQRLDQLLQPL